MNKLLAFVAVATFLMMMSLIHYAAWAEDANMFQCPDSTIQLKTRNLTSSELQAECVEVQSEIDDNEDFSDSGVGCTDDCLDPVQE